MDFNKSELTEKFTTELTSTKAAIRNTMNELALLETKYPEVGAIATSNSERHILNRRNLQLTRQSAQYQQIIKKIDNDEYGICDRCFDEIDSERLKLQPASIHCVDCLTRIERENK